MTRKPFRIAWALLGLTLAAWPCLGQDQPSTSKRVGDKLENAVKSLKRSAKEAGDSIQHQYERARASVHNLGVSGRVYARLHWDKALTSTKIEIDVKENGVATLSGTVPDAKAKAKALELTQDTVGVVRVVDQMTVLPPSTAAPAASAPATPEKP